MINLKIIKEDKLVVVNDPITIEDLIKGLEAYDKGNYKDYTILTEEVFNEMLSDELGIEDGERISDLVEYPDNTDTTFRHADRYFQN